MASEEVEMCSGCGDVAPVGAHPIVGIGFDGPPEDGKFAKFPVCGRCHREPLNRKNPLKMHFFAREQGDEALRRAGSSDIGG